MTKRTNTYKLTLEALSLAKEDEIKSEPLTIEFDNHDNIFNIIKAIKQKDLFQTEGDSAEFAIGLKLFGEVMLKNRDNDLFAELKPAFAEFMKKLKSK
ncbi:DUF3861 domain-containing protein [Pedobacter sp. AW1-32]|uniref:DUF3861 domain-containing protein n=1 Tax=Pedobacter sp. AW1-32 TaxID=3383026 RepID=UPI003FEFF246